jgi:hypothetical protein
LSAPLVTVTTQDLQVIIFCAQPSFNNGCEV